MKVYLDPSFANEKYARKKYLQETFKIIFCEKQDSTLKYIIMFESFPQSFEKDVCIIFGHCFFVAYLLGLNIIKEKEIFIISCSLSHPDIFKYKGKKIYLVPQQNGYAIQRLGEEYGFNFNPTDAEINMFLNKRDNAKEKLLKEFKLIK